MRMALMEESNAILSQMCIPGKFILVNLFFGLSVCLYLLY